MPLTGLSSFFCMESLLNDTLALIEGVVVKYCQEVGEVGHTSIKTHSDNLTLIHYSGASTE